MSSSRIDPAIPASRTHAFALNNDKASKGSSRLAEESLVPSDTGHRGLPPISLQLQANSYPLQAHERPPTTSTVQTIAGQPADTHQIASSTELFAYPQSPQRTATPTPDALSQVEEEDSRLTLPTWISPVRTDLDPDMLWLLKRKKALSIPTQPLRDSLLQAYVDYVHPFLPLLDLAEFRSMSEGKDENKKISIVLYQAVMFAGAAFVDIEQLQLEGFTTHKRARRTYYERVRLLFDADVELEPIVLVQVLLLLTYWFDKIEDTKSRCYWMRIAWSFANDRGLADPSVLALLPEKEQKLRRRLWWCCFMRDQLISFSERRGSSLQINEADFPPLYPTDFESPTIAKENYAASPDDVQSSLTELCLAKIRLCILIRRVLCSQYELKLHPRITSTEPNLLFLPKTSESTAFEHVARAQELCAWNSAFFPKLKSKGSDDGPQDDAILTVHRTMLEMLYWTVVGLIHRPQLVAKSIDGTVKQQTEALLRKAAERVTDIASSLQEEDLLRFQPPIIVTSLFGAALQHLKDTTSAIQATNISAQESFAQTMSTLNRLQEIWFSADNVVNFIVSKRSKRFTAEGTGASRPTRSTKHQNAANAHTLRPGLSAEIPALSGTGDHFGSLELQTAPSDGRSHGLDTFAFTYGIRGGSHNDRSTDFTVTSPIDLDYVPLSGSFDFTEFDFVDWTNILMT